MHERIGQPPPIEPLLHLVLETALYENIYTLYAY